MLDQNFSDRITTEISDRQKQATSFDSSIFPTLMGKKWATLQCIRDMFIPSYTIYACWPDQSVVGGWDSRVICGVDNLRIWYRDPTSRRSTEVTIRVPDEAAGREIGEVFGSKFREGGFSLMRRNAPGANDGGMVRILVADYRATGPDGGHGWRTHYVPT